MPDFSILLVDAVITLFSFFVAAPMILSAISNFSVQKHFADAMVAEGVIAEVEVKRLLPKKQLAGVIISAIVVVAIVLTAGRMAPYGYICAVAGFGGGLLKYRRVIQFNSLTVKRFQSTFKDSYDAKKLNAYVDSHF